LLKFKIVDLDLLLPHVRIYWKTGNPNKENIKKSQIQTKKSFCLDLFHFFQN
jgi:hypothetical protein